MPMVSGLSVRQDFVWVFVSSHLDSPHPLPSYKAAVPLLARQARLLAERPCHPVCQIRLLSRDPVHSLTNNRLVLVANPHLNPWLYYSIEAYACQCILKCLCLNFELFYRTVLLKLVSCNKIGVLLRMGKPKKRTTPRRTGSRRSHLTLKLARAVNAKSPVKVYTTKKELSQNSDK